MLAREKTLANTVIITTQKAMPQCYQPTRNRATMLKQHSATSWRSSNNGCIVPQPHLCWRPPTSPLLQGEASSIDIQSEEKASLQGLFIFLGQEESSAFAFKPSPWKEANEFEAPEDGHASNTQAFCITQDWFPPTTRGLGWKRSFTAPWLGASMRLKHKERIVLASRCQGLLIN